MLPGPGVRQVRAVVADRWVRAGNFLIALLPCKIDDGGNCSNDDDGRRRAG